MNTVYHYTNQKFKLPRILESGVLLPRADVEDEVPLLWFSSHPHWEPTATKPRVIGSVSVSMSFAEYRHLAGCVRFALPSDDSRLMAWRDACKFAGIPRRDRIAMEALGRKLGGHPKQWFAVAGAVSLEDVTMQTLNGKSWEVTA